MKQHTGLEGQVTQMRHAVRFGQRQACVATAPLCSATVHQMALSGRAAKRMAEATHATATTIAKFLAAVRTDIPAVAHAVRRHVIPAIEAAPEGDVGVSFLECRPADVLRVVVVISESRILDHALVYTARTRGVHQVVFIGDRAAFERAVREAPLAQRRRTAFVV